jgi:hypothetical protein
MASNRRIDIILIAVAAAVTITGIGLAWPGMREAWVCRRGLEDIESKMADRPDRTDEVERLAELIEAINIKMDREFRTVPETPDVAGVVRALSVPVDGVTVRDQTFATHAPVDAAPNPNMNARATPITVDMTATFDAIYSLLRTTESMDRLVRVSSLRLGRDAKVANELHVGPPILTASIGLEAIFESDDESGRD